MHLQCLFKPRWKKLWRHEYGYPLNIRTYGQLYSWVLEQLELQPADKKLNLLREELETGENQFLVEKTEDVTPQQPKKLVIKIKRDEDN